jgi:inner membrane protein
MDENDPNSSVFSFSIEKVNERWIAAPFYPVNPDEEDVLNFWNRIKGI